MSQKITCVVYGIKLDLAAQLLDELGAIARAGGLIQDISIRNNSYDKADTVNVRVTCDQFPAGPYGHWQVNDVAPAADEWNKTLNAVNEQNRALTAANEKLTREINELKAWAPDHDQETAISGTIGERLRQEIDKLREEKAKALAEVEALSGQRQE